MKKIKNYFQSIYFKTEGVSILGFAIVISGAVLWRLLFNQPIPETYLYVLICVALLFGAIGSFNVVRYKEMPRVGFKNITGFWAVFWGTLYLIISVITIIILLSEILRNLLK